MTHRWKSASAALIVTLTTSTAWAGFSDLKSPNVVKGELETEYSFGTTFDGDNTKNHDSGHELEIEYGVTDRLRVELEGELEKEPGEGYRYEATGIGTSFQLFAQGENWLDSGVELAYEHAAHEDDADAVSAQLMLEKTSGPYVHRANLRLEQEIGSNAEGGPSSRFLWNSRYLYNRYFEPGFEIQSDFGKMSDSLGFNQGGHYVGPSVYGRIMPGLKYEAAYYRGISDAAANSGLRLKMEYEMYF